MGTRSITSFYMDGEHLLSIYKQSDGDNDVWGEKIRKFTKSKKFTNGIIGDCFNGFDDYVAQFMKEFKKGAGDIYVISEEEAKREYSAFMKNSYSTMVAYFYRVEWKTTYRDKNKEEAEITITCTTDVGTGALRKIKSTDEKIKVRINNR